MDKGLKCIISIDRIGLLDGGIIDITDIAQKIMEPAHLASLFRWIAKYHDAECALLCTLDEKTGRLTVSDEYYDPKPKAAPHNGGH